MASGNNYDFINFSSDEEDVQTTFPLAFKLERDSKLPIMSNTSNSSTTSVDDDDTMDSGIQVPTHPIAAMQGAFAESMKEAAENPNPAKQPTATSAARRKKLLDQDLTEETHSERWQRKPGQKWHELWKLMAQISFGIYLLLNEIAKDDEQVMNILQGHVDEIDEFLETTLDDFDLAQEDIQERLKFLKLPLENIVIFDAMLEDRGFRNQIISGNERIEHVIQRTASAMNDALKDVQHGLDACKEFSAYLAEEQEIAAWRPDRPEMEKVFEASKGNCEGWVRAFMTLQEKGKNLGTVLVQLGSIVAEMDRRAGEVSRKTRYSIVSQTVPVDTLSPPSSPPRHSKQMRLSMTKNLPSDPSIITPAISAALPVFQMVPEREPSPDLSRGRRSLSPETVSQPEPDFILKPRTYSPSPAPSPRPREVKAPQEIQPLVIKRPEPAPARAPDHDPRVVPGVTAQAALQALDRTRSESPEVDRKSSLRKRISNSFKRKDTPSEITLRPAPTANQYKEERQRVISVTTPPSRGPDSAYCSDLEKPLSPPNPLSVHPVSEHSRSRSPSARIPSPTNPPLSRGSHNNFPTNQQPASAQSAQAFPIPPSSHSAYAPPFTRDYLPSPRSDTGPQFFRPVNASPHSPLQRPWTAGSPPGALNSNPAHSLHHQKSFTNQPHHPRQPSRMGMSMMSEMTTMTMEDGKKVKKKRSAFGWFKKAFSMTEEEKAEFEAKRRQGEEEERNRYRAYGARRGREEVRFLDGKRVR
ncbi:hypothetical protein BP6252_03765 [Coleophoma cylindrospora]|uniref:Uncharacterized protein n=1 Tax=Coleophoma cylindrospora TaxID=1849047 RepID=A0A3D8S8N4_9HELO|nr:hypothetical protein BP6252_03765 [Coleophoma cylindrospora]